MRWNPVAVFGLGLVVGITLMMWLADKKIQRIVQHPPRYEVPCANVYTNSHGQKICIPYFPDSVYRK